MVSLACKRKTAFEARQLPQDVEEADSNANFDHQGALSHYLPQSRFLTLDVVYLHILSCNDQLGSY